jgi:hypothetical protein
LEEKQQLAQQNVAEFLSPGIDGIFDELKQTNAADPDIVEIIEQHKNLLVAYREHGIITLACSLAQDR